MSHADQLAAITKTDGLGESRDGPKRVIIVGAGIAGLAAADLLQRSGHDVLLLEGQHRVGGRIYTVREGLAPGLFAEMGAMRIPEKHELTMAYVKRFRLKTEAFTMNNLKTLIHLQGTSVRRGKFNPKDYDFGERRPIEERLKPQDLLHQTLDSLFSRLKNAIDQHPAWDRIEKQYDHHSLRSYLKNDNWSDGAIEMLGLVENIESRMNSSFVEFLHHEYSSTFSGDMFYLTGGMDGLPKALLKALENASGSAFEIRFGAVLEQILQHEHTVTVGYRTDGVFDQVEANYLIVTIPYSLMRHINVDPRLSPGKARAIRQVNYDASSKIFMQFRRRFWEDESAEDICGGGSITDLSIRNVYYPDHGRETGRGALLASYTWGRDSTYLASLPRPYLIQLVLDNLEGLHPGAKEYYEGSSIHHWGLDPFAGGVGVLLEPNQSDLFEDIVSSVGRIYFAGDHCSRHEKRWIQGALESALITACTVHNAQP